MFVVAATDFDLTGALAFFAAWFFGGGVCPVVFCVCHVSVSFVWVDDFICCTFFGLRRAPERGASKFSWWWEGGDGGA